MQTLIHLFRLSNFLYRARLRPFSRFIDLCNFFLFGCSIPGSVTLGKGTTFEHHGLGVVIHKDASVGSGCIIGVHVVIGGRGNGELGVPTVHDNVYIGSGAKLLGNINIGSGAVIGANAVVIKDVPKDTVAIGVPAKYVVKNK